MATFLCLILAIPHLFLCALFSSAWDILHNSKYHFANWPCKLSFAKTFSLKQAAAILLIVAFIAQSFSKPFIMAGYYANTAAYAKNCENKAKPKLNCNGKCQMVKKLQQEEKKEKENTERKADGKQDVLSSKSFYATLHFKSVDIKTIYPSCIDGKAVGRPHTFFHPPGA